MNKLKNCLSATRPKLLIKIFSIFWCEVDIKKYLQYICTYLSNYLIVYKVYVLCILEAINNPPKPYIFTIFTLKGQISNVVKKDDSSINMLNVFNLKLKKNDVPKKRLENDKNLAGKAKHYTPASKEWFNSVYAYNKNTLKTLPIFDRVMLKLVKSYFNIYSNKLEKKIRSRRLRIRMRRLSTNRILVSKPELKHTSDKIIVTLYVYNRQEKYYFNKIKRIASTDDLLLSNLKAKIIKNKSLKLKSKVIKHQKMLLKTLNINNKADHNKLFEYETKYLKDYVSKTLRREIFSIYLWQLISFNLSKFEENYLLPLTNLAKRIYNKEIVFNLVNLKYLYLDSHIFSETLVTKLRNRKNRLLRVLKTSLLMFKLPAMDNIAVYDEIYNKERKLQNLGIDNIIPDYSQINDKGQLENKDMLELLLLKKNPSNLLVKLKDADYSISLSNTILKFIKHKHVSGIRIEVAGRLTRRNTADRSVFKLRYKGNIKNMDSSYKGLPTVLLRGYAKSNLQYTNLKSKIRIGSFGLKGWVSSS